MKEISISVPTGTFPADIGDRVRISLTNLNGLEMVDAFVMAIQTGCGVSDKVLLRYDETLLPFGAQALNACMITGFQKQCSCCSAKPCYEIFAPDSIVSEGTKHVLILPGDYRLDRIKFFSPNPAEVPLSLQVLVGGVELFPRDLVMDEEALTVARPVFSSVFSKGLIPAGTTIEITVVDAPQYLYYDTPWRGLSVCLLGIWYPHAKTVAGSLRRARGTRPPPDVPPVSGYPANVVVDGEGNYVVDGEGNFVVES